MPGLHYVELREIAAEFAPPHDRRRVETNGALEILVSALKSLIPSGDLYIAGTFASHQPGPIDAPCVAVIPHDPTTLEVWTDAEEARFIGFESLYDVIVGGLGAEYVPVLHPLSGLLEVYYVPPEMAVEFAKWLGATTLSDGTEVIDARGVLEVEW